MTSTIYPIPERSAPSIRAALGWTRGGAITFRGRPLLATQAHLPASLLSPLGLANLRRGGCPRPGVRTPNNSQSVFSEVQSRHQPRGCASQVFHQQVLLGSTHRTTGEFQDVGKV